MPDHRPQRLAWLTALGIALGLTVFGCDRADESAAQAPDLLAWDESTKFDLGTSEATLGCDPGDSAAAFAHRVPVAGLGSDALRQFVGACAPGHVIHLELVGSIQGDFARLIRALSDLAEEAGVPRRILDVNSPGGDVVVAMRAGDVMGDRDWAMRVRAGASCNSACVMLLAAARFRVVLGEVGIHRVFAAHSQATSREELARDLESIVAQIRAYLVKHGASPGIVDAMQAVPAREIRKLDHAELAAFGLLGANAAQEDLERVKVVQRCGMDFVRRAEAWAAAFESECVAPAEAQAEARGESPLTVQCDVVACGLQLEARFGFPSETCPTESPVTRTGAWLLCRSRPRLPASGPSSSNVGVSRRVQ